MSPFSNKGPGHGLLHAGTVALAIITQICAVVFFVLAQEYNVPNALFQTSALNVSETLSLEVTMDHWAQNNWLMIDSWSLAWLVEAVVRLCRRNVFGPEACNPELHPPLFYLMWASVNSARICSMLLWDRNEILAAFILSATQPALSFYMLYTSYSNLDKNKAWLAINNPNVIWWTRYLTQSGVALFAWWTLLTAALHFGIVLKYKAGVEDTAASSIVLTAIFMFTLIWFFLQSLIFIKYMRYTFTVYPVSILGLGAIFTKNFQISMTSNIMYCGFLMLLVTILNSIHLLIACLYKGSDHEPPLVQPSVSLETVCHPQDKCNKQKQEWDI